MELLATTAIIAGVVALLLPAVQAARESARRTDCQSRLRNIGLALLAHHDVTNGFPVGCVDCSVPPPVVPPRLTAWNVWILPHLEQGPLFAKFDPRQPSYLPANAEAAATEVVAFICPSTEAEAQFGGANQPLGFTDYGGLYGVEGAGHEADFEAEQTLLDEWLGAMLYESPVSLEQIVDGASNTAIVGEMLIRRCSRECQWANGHNLFAQDKATPVNGRSGLGNDLGSPHSGGALVAFADGHVAFVVNETEQFVLNALLTKEGD